MVTFCIKNIGLFEKERKCNPEMKPSFGEQKIAES